MFRNFLFEPNAWLGFGMMGCFQYQIRPRVKGKAYLALRHWRVTSRPSQKAANSDQVGIFTDSFHNRNHNHNQ